MEAMMSNTTVLQLKEGGWYKRRDGEIVGPAIKFDDERYPWQVGEQLIYTSIGKFHFDGAKDSRDLICEVPPPIDGYRPSGEFRVPVNGQDGFYSNLTDDGSWCVYGCNTYVSDTGDSKRWIAEKIPDEAKPKPVDNPIVANASKLAAFADRMEAAQSEPEELTEADVEPEAGYRILDINEEIREGDELQSAPGIWIASEAWREGQLRNLRCLYRRRVESTAEPADGWIDWPGGECPVSKDAFVEVRYRNGQTEKRQSTKHFWMWSTFPDRSDIVAYREVPADQPAEPSYPLESRVRPVASGEQQPAEPEKQPQPGEWWWACRDADEPRGPSEALRCVGLTYSGHAVWEDSNRAIYRGTEVIPIRHLPDCTGFDYVPPPEQTPAEKRLRELGIERDTDGDYRSVRHRTVLGLSDFTSEQVEAIAAHMREREGGEE
jgi:hypothetical protein